MLIGGRYCDFFFRVSYIGLSVIRLKKNRFEGIADHFGYQLTVIDYFIPWLG